MALMGMDTASGATCAKSFQTAAEQLKTMVGTLTTAMNFQWEGADATRMKQTDFPNFSKQLTGIAETLANWSKEIQRNVTEQEGASKS